MNQNPTNAVDESRAVLLDLLANSLGRHRREAKHERGRTVPGEPDPPTSGAFDRARPTLPA